MALEANLMITATLTQDLVEDDQLCVERWRDLKDKIEALVADESYIPISPVILFATDL